MNKGKRYTHRNYKYMRNFADLDLQLQELSPLVPQPDSGQAAEEWRRRGALKAVAMASLPWPFFRQVLFAKARRRRRILHQALEAITWLTHQRAATPQLSQSGRAVRRHVALTLLYGSSWIHLLERTVLHLERLQFAWPLLVVSIGKDAFKACQQLQRKSSSVRVGCWRPNTPSQVHRFTIIHILLHLGVDVFYFDMDTFFLKNPLPALLSQVRRGKYEILFSGHGDGDCVAAPFHYPALLTYSGDWSLLLSDVTRGQGLWDVHVASSDQHRRVLHQSDVQNPAQSSGTIKSHWPQDSERALATKDAKVTKPDEIDLEKVVADAEDADDERLARELSEYDDVSDSIVAAAVRDAETNNPEVEIELARAKRQQEIASAVVIPSGPVYDVLSLVDKYGGTSEVYENHKVAAQAGYFQQLPQIRKFLFDFVDVHRQNADQSFVEFEHATGSKLVLVGTNHISRNSTEFARQTVLKERPECLVIERRLGDDSLQRLTLPEKQLQEKLMAKPPAEFLSSDTAIDRARKFQTDRMWLEASAGWRDIGGEAAVCHEFGAAVEAFAQLRKEGTDGQGPRGGTLCFGDSDLRPLYKRTQDAGMPPSLNDLGLGANVALRDLQFSKALRVAMRTHKSVVGVIGDGHLAGITKLMQQDPQVRVVKQGVPLDPPSWEDDMKDRGRKWEREALGGGLLFMRLVEAIDASPIGNWMDAEAVLELEAMKEETSARLEEDGLEAEPVAPSSSQLGEDFTARGLLVTPKNEQELRRWLSGQRLGGQEAGEFPFENRRLRKAAPKLPNTGFPYTKEEAERAQEENVVMLGSPLQTPAGELGVAFPPEDLPKVRVGVMEDENEVVIGFVGWYGHVSRMLVFHWCNSPLKDKWEEINAAYDAAEAIEASPTLSNVR
ncbi:unnamed protein product [Symbiodinium natans]|uniref:Nucleotide-diphospho-sugar transferase domain-containing protein n=1 Tax=Symbiodinium natans TaxID=878477 RepID=A0A812SPT8_9DINO|nr:unnamed protein product [Symbiodinium natans]